MPERALDANRVPASNRAKRLLREIIDLLQNYEDDHRLRRRRRRQSDLTIFEKSISAIVSDLIVWDILFPGEWLYISLSHRNLRRNNRYEPFSFGSTLSYNLRLLETPEIGFVEKRLGRRVVD